MIIVAQRGEDTVLVAHDDMTRAFIANTALKQRWPSLHMQAILGRGYWEERDHDPKLLDKILNTYKLVGENTT